MSTRRIRRILLLSLLLLALVGLVAACTVCAMHTVDGEHCECPICRAARTVQVFAVALGVCLLATAARGTHTTQTHHVRFVPACPAVRLNC